MSTRSVAPRGSVEPLLLAGFADIAVGEVVTADITPFVQPYAIEVSEDLRSWTVAVPSVPSQGASTVSSLPRTSSPAHRFFRVRAL